MGWLDKRGNNAKSEPSGRPPKPAAAATRERPQGGGTIIGPGLKIEGRLESDEDVWIAGEVSGEVMCKQRITVAASGRIQGQVQCETMVIFGVVEGNVTADDLIRIEDSGKLIGDITTKIFTNLPGGFFEGYSHMMNDKKPVSNNLKNFSKSKSKNKNQDEEEA